MSAEGNSINFQISQYNKVYSDNRKVVVDVQMQTTEIYSEDVLRAALPTLNGKEVRVFHIAPEVDPESFVGVVRNAYWDDEKNQPRAVFEIDDSTKTSQLCQTIVLAEKDLPPEKRSIKGVSVGVVERRRAGKVHSVFFRELSLARNPACKDCTDMKISVEAYEERSVNSIAENNIQSIVKAFEETNTLKDQKIKEYESTVELQDQKLQEYAQKVAQFEQQLAEKDEAIAEKEQQIVQLEKDVEDAAKVPLIDRIMEFEGVPADEKAREKRAGELKGLARATIESMVKSHEVAEKKRAAGLTPTQEGNAPDLNYEDLTTASFDAATLTPEERFKLTNQMIAKFEGKHVPGQSEERSSGGF